MQFHTITVRGHAFRFTSIGGHPWFVAADVLKARHGVASGKGWRYVDLPADEILAIPKASRAQLVEPGQPGARPSKLISEKAFVRIFGTPDEARPLVRERVKAGAVKRRTYDWSRVQKLQAAGLGHRQIAEALDIEMRAYYRLTMRIRRAKTVPSLCP